MWIELGVLGVAVEEKLCFTQSACGKNGIDALPEQVGWIEIRTKHAFTAPGGLGSRLGQADECVGVVDAETRVGFPRDSDSMLAAEFGLSRPVGNQDLLPLIFENVRVFRWPGTGHPVRLLVGGGPTGTSAEGDDDVRPEHGSELHGAHEGIMIGFGLTLRRVDGIAVHREARADQTVFGKQPVDSITLALGGKRLGRIDEPCTRIATDGKFDRIESAFGTIRQGLFEVAPIEKSRHHTEFHLVSPEPVVKESRNIASGN